MRLLSQHGPYIVQEAGIVLPGADNYYVADTRHRIVDPARHVSSHRSAAAAITAAHVAAQAYEDAHAFYVSVISGPRKGLLLGPLDTHQEALDRVEDVRAWVIERDDRAWWYAFGTAAVPVADARPGRLNAQLATA